MGFNITEQELIVLAGTDTSGTTMHGLSEAAKAKGLSATGMKLSVDDLKPNNIVHIILDGEGHYSVIREVSENSVYLADPSLGNIEMTREEFAEIFTGNALVISNPNMQVNQTAEQANSSTENLTDQIDNVTNQTDQMQDLTNSTDANGATERTNNQDNENTTLIGPVANVTNTNSTNLLTKNTNNLTNEEMLNIKGKSWLFPLWFGIEIGYRYATHNRYGAVDGWCWASELISGVDINKDGWVGVPDEARRFGVNGEGYRVKAASKIKKSKKRKKMIIVTPIFF
jgi:predicted double-glycine peptidase